MKALNTFTFTLLLGGLVAAPATAQVTCADIEWSAETRANYPPIEDACLEMVERGGVTYARLHARVLRDGTRSVVIQYEHNDNSWGAPREVTPPEGFRVLTDGGMLAVNDLERNQELNVYLREGRWEWALSDLAEPEIDESALMPLPHAEPLEPVEPIEPVAEVAVEPPAEPAAQEEPSSRMWFWIIGAVALIAIFMMARRKKA